jgi:hypothetical protein
MGDALDDGADLDAREPAGEDIFAELGAQAAADPVPAVLEPAAPAGAVRTSPVTAGVAVASARLPVSIRSNILIAPFIIVRTPPPCEGEVVRSLVFRKSIALSAGTRREARSLQHFSW